MKKLIDLPVSMKLAANCTSLDKIKIVPVDYEIGVRHTIKILKFFGWEKRLINKCIKIINKDIDDSIEKDKNSKFYVYIMGTIYSENLIFMRLDSHYEIK